MSRGFLPILALVMAFICHFAIERSSARTAPTCFFVDGKALCGEEGELAREQQRKTLEAKLVHNIMYSNIFLSASFALALLVP